jgi:uncharacterized protein with NRDE domain
MCILFLAYRYFEDIPLAISNNRDEARNRNTKFLHQWEDLPVVAGRDLEKQGSWFGVNPNSKKFIILTNYRVYDLVVSTSGNDDDDDDDVMMKYISSEYLTNK